MPCSACNRRRKRRNEDRHCRCRRRARIRFALSLHRAVSERRSCAAPANPRRADRAGGFRRASALSSARPPWSMWRRSRQCQSADASTRVGLSRRIDRFRCAQPIRRESGVHTNVSVWNNAPLLVIRDDPPCAADRAICSPGWPFCRHRVGPRELTVERRRLGRSVVKGRAVDVLGFSLKRIGARSQAVRHHSVTDQLRHASPMGGSLSKRRGGSRTPARSQVFRHFSTKDVDVSFHRSETAFT